MGCSNNTNTQTKEKTPITPPDSSLTNTKLLTTVQKDVLNYFWDYANPNSKLARERYFINDPTYDANIVTTGGSGFGLMTILVGIKNGYIPRTEAVNRLTTALNFLAKADRFHGAWSHWIDGKTGKAIAFTPHDDGGDLVETAFLVEGLICVREFFKDSSIPAEKKLAQKADTLWKGVEWNWYTQGQDVLYWHWSPNYDFQMNMKIQGYNEALIVYVLAAASPTYPITKKVYTQGWCRNGAIKSTGTMYGIPVIVNHNGQHGNVGPMFWSQYSFIGLDPRGLTDDYVDYGAVTKNHADIMYQYCVKNPKGWSGYSKDNWGLTASYTRNADGSTGYTAHAPNNDTGVISPTAALSDMPYTPQKSINVLRFIYQHKENFVGVAGPYDAYSLQYNWVTPRYLAIDQGPIAPMIENYKTQFLWNLFMGAPEVKAGLLKLGFHSTQHGF